MIYENITDLIGNTPLLKIDVSRYGIKNINVYAKLEMFNPFGSVKDRAAWGMVKDEIQHIVEEGNTMIESSSGNTGKSLAMIGNLYGIKYKTVTNRIKVPEVKNILQLIGAEIEELPGLSECPDPTDPNDPVAYLNTQKQKNPGKYFHPNQYENQKNPDMHYHTTGAEIAKDLGKVDYFFGGLGTAGSTIGTARKLRESNPELNTIGIIAEKGDFLPGIRNIDEMQEVGIFQKDLYADMQVVNAQGAIEGTLNLIRNHGVLGGPTSGAAFYGTIEYVKKYDDAAQKGTNAVFIVCDRVEWYISYFQKRRPDLFDTNKKVEEITQAEIEQVYEVSVEAYEQWVSKNTPIVIDLRGAMAFRSAHLPNSINIVDSSFEELLSFGTPFSSAQTVLLVCPHGDKSRQFAARLIKKGVNAASLRGGVLAWRDAGRSFERNSL